MTNAQSETVFTLTISAQEVRVRYRPHHIGGNERIANAGHAIIGGNFAAQMGENTGAAIVAHQNVLNWMSSPADGEKAALRSIKTRTV